MSQTLYHVAYAGRLLGPGMIGEESPVADGAVEALHWYGWYRVVEGTDELDAIQQANIETGNTPESGEVYYVTAFVQEQTQKVEVIL